MADTREYFKLDVGYLENPKIVALIDAGKLRSVLLHIECMAYARRHRTDGKVPLGIAQRIVGATKRDVAPLLAGGERALLTDMGDGNVQVHDFLEHQQSADDIARLSEAGKVGARARWGADGNSGRNANRMRRPMPRREEKRREEETPNGVSPTAAPATADIDGFAAFWAAYPRRDDKGHAIKAFTAAARKTDPTLIIEAAGKFARMCERERRERKFIPLAATWLNGERWGDEPPGAGHSEPDPLGREPNITELRLAGLLP